MPSHPTQFVSWVRSVAPYFHAFRGKTFVLAFGGEIFAERRFVDLAHDVSLLHSTGIRVVLARGSRPQVDALAIAGCLDAGNIAIVSPVGYSPTGEVFNLAMEDVAVATATALHAEKLIFFSDAPVQDKEGELLPELTAEEAAGLLARSNRLSDDTRLYLTHAVEAVRGGMQRAHIISRTVHGALLD